MQSVLNTIEPTIFPLPAVVPPPSPAGDLAALMGCPNVVAGDLLLKVQVVPAASFRYDRQECLPEFSPAESAAAARLVPGVIPP